MWWYLVFILLAGSFGWVLFFGAPYLPSHKKQALVALDLLGLKNGQTLYELGCGDASVMILAAKRGVKSVGYELNPIIFCIAKLRSLRYRNLMEVRYGNFWNTDISNADGVYVFLLDRFMPKLDKKLSKELKKGAKLASYTFKIPGKKPIQEKSGIYIYEY